MSEHGVSYRAAGVDIDAAEEAMRGIAGMLRSTRTPDTLSELGSFGGLYRVPRGMQSPVLVASTDGVGTKLKVAFMSGRHDSVGEDLVNHCVNDILVQGARPLFFLDYLGLGKLVPGVVESIVAGVARGCRANGCALLGGETAEMPDFYAPGEYDIAGTIVGVVEEGAILDGTQVRPGNVLVGIASDGLHTNGYSLARKLVFAKLGLGVADPFPGEDGSVADVLLRGHRSYLRPIEGLLDEGLVLAMSHITGGGLLDNLPRVLPEGVSAQLDLSSWEVPNLFRVLQQAGSVDPREMFRVFNMGVGMVLIVNEATAPRAVEHLGAQGETAWVLGRIRAGDREVILS